MTLQELAPVLRQALLALGLLFVIVNLKVGAQIAQLVAHAPPGDRHLAGAASRRSSPSTSPSA